MERKTLFVSEVAEYMGVSKDLIYELVRKKEIPHVKMSRRILFNKETLDKWFDEQESKSMGMNK